MTANRLNFISKQRNSDSRDGVCQLQPHVPRRMLVHVRKLCTCLQGSHRIQRAINRDTLYLTSLLIGRYVAQKNIESLYRAFSRWPYWCCETKGKGLNDSQLPTWTLTLCHDFQYIKILTWYQALGLNLRKIRSSVKAGYWTDCAAVRPILPTWYDHLEECFFVIKEFS